ncbi:MAG: glycosyltransferase [candidate division Zixibacteria bacterium]|nr:glycosyltransferase [candidate division Zixibacteria bacterium]
MKKLLMITYDFPPARTSGIYRPVKFVKHLRSFGWEPIVLTARNAGALARDETLLKDIPAGVQVVRTFSVDLFELTRRLHDFLYRRKSTGGSLREETKAAGRVAPSPASGEGPKRGWLKRYFFHPLNDFVEEWLFIPDRMIGWFPFAFFAALRIMVREKPDVVFSTSTPQTSHVVGLCLKLLFRKPWIVDLRDNWFIGHEHYHRSNLRQKLDHWLCRQFLRRGDQVVTMAQGNADDLLAAFPDPEQSKYQAITNGFDRDDFPDLPVSGGHNHSDKLVMLHIGTLYDGTAGQFFHALADLCAEDRQNSRDIESEFIGYVGAQYQTLIGQLGLANKLSMPGFKPHPEAIQAMLDADVLLMFLGAKKITNQQFPGKYFEYLNARKFILAIGKPGEIAASVENSRCGILVPLDDAAAIRQTITDLLQRKRAGDLTVTPDWDFIAQYEYRNLTGKLAHVLQKAIDRNGAAKR